MTKRIRCKVCGERFTYVPMGRGRPPAFCSEYCRQERQREWSREAMTALRRRRGPSRRASVVS